MRIIAKSGTVAGNSLQEPDQGMGGYGSSTGRARGGLPGGPGTRRLLRGGGTGRRRVGLVAVCLAALVVAGCSASGGGAGGDRTGGGGRLRVVATTTQVADLAANVGGDRVQVTSLLKPGIDPHDYEPSPADIDAIARADLVLENG